MDNLAPASRPELPTGCSGKEAFVFLLRASADRLQETARAFLFSSAPEPCHHLRVALRRHRCLLKAFEKALAPDFVTDQIDRAREIGRRLAPLRQLDVLANETLPALAAAKRPDGGESEAKATERAAAKLADGFEALAKKLKREASRQRSALKRGDLSVSFGALLLDLAAAMTDEGWRAEGARKRSFSRDARKQVAPALTKAFRKLREYGERMDSLTIEERHDMRKKAKVLRYSVEFFGSLYDPHEVKAYRSALKQLQKSFGALNDAADALALAEMKIDAALRPAIKAAIAESERRMRAEFETAKQRWSVLQGTPQFW